MFEEPGATGTCDVNASLDGIRPVEAKWVYTWKTDEMGLVVVTKARLMAKGCSPFEGQSYDETFAPVAASIRYAVAVVCETSS